MSMKINTATSMIAEPLFPQHSFVGDIELSEIQIDSIIKEITTQTLYKYNWGMSGWNEDSDDVWHLTPRIQSVAPLILKQCFDAITNQYNFPSMGNILHIGKLQYFLEVRRCFPLILYPGHDYPYFSHLGAFNGITILKCTNDGHKVYTRNLNYNVMEDNLKFWPPQPKQQIFLPGKVSWGISAGNDSSQTVALISHILLKRTN